jgi:hypothetical protein
MGKQWKNIEGVAMTVIRMATVIFCLFCMSGLAAAEPFARVADLPAENSEFYELWKMNLADVRVPDRTEVPVPAYPGARVIRVLRVGDPDDAGPRKTPKIVMLSTDKRTKVAAFYRKSLQGWKEGGGQTMAYFWTDSESFAVGPIAYMDTPSVVISDMGPMNFMERSLMPDAKTVITIVYRPRQ